jgi:hypothetical protein
MGCQVNDSALTASSSWIMHHGSLAQATLQLPTLSLNEFNTSPLS